MGMGDYSMARDKGQLQVVHLGSFPRTEEHLNVGAVGTGKTESRHRKKGAPVCLDYRRHRK